MPYRAVGTVPDVRPLVLSPGVHDVLTDLGGTSPTTHPSVVRRRCRPRPRVYRGTFKVLPTLWVLDGFHSDPW